MLQSSHRTVTIVSKTEKHKPTYCKDCLRSFRASTQSRGGFAFFIARTPKNPLGNTRPPWPQYHRLNPRRSRPAGAARGRHRRLPRPPRTHSPGETGGKTWKGCVSALYIPNCLWDKKAPRHFLLRLLLTRARVDVERPDEEARPAFMGTPC